MKKDLWLEVLQIIEEKEREAHSAYSFAYQYGGENYEARMKECERRLHKWRNRRLRMGGSNKNRLINAIIKWM